MRTILMAVVLLGLKLSAYGQCTNIYGEDVWFYSYNGDETKSGVLAYGQGDYVIGSALTSSALQGNGIPWPYLPTCTWTTFWDQNLGDALIIENQSPACNGVHYVIDSYQRSFRQDGQDDHIEQDGISWGSNPGDSSNPALISQMEAGSLLGSNGQKGTANIFVYRFGLCNPPN